MKKKSIFSLAEKLFFRKAIYLFVIVTVIYLAIAVYGTITANYPCVIIPGVVMLFVLTFLLYLWAIKRQKHQHQRSDRISAWSIILDLIAIAYPWIFGAVLIWLSFLGLHAAAIRAVC